MEPVTARMKEDINLQMTLDLQSVKEDVAGLREIVKQHVEENGNGLL